MSTVTAEVTRQLTATLPAFATQLRPQPPLATRDASELAEEPASTHDVSATTLVEGAIAAAHSWITAAPQLLPSTNAVMLPSNPSQILISADLPIDSQVSTKIKDKIWNEEFVDFDALLSNPGHDKCQISLQNSQAGASFCLEPVSRSKSKFKVKVQSRSHI